MSDGWCLGMGFQTGKLRDRECRAAAVHKVPRLWAISLAFLSLLELVVL